MENVDFSLSYEDLMEDYDGSAEMQYQAALYNLYGKGGAPMDSQKAAQYLEKAAEQGYEPAAEKLREMRSGNSGAKLGAVSRENIGKWCVRVMEGDAEAMIQMAEYLDKNPDQRFEADFLELLKQAADNGSGEACLRLYRYYDDHGQVKNGIPYLKNAADCGSSEAMRILGQCYYQGRGVEKDPKQAEFWFAKRANSGDPRAMMEMALRYKSGLGVPTSLIHALGWKQRAEDAGLADTDRLFAADKLEIGWDLEQFRTDAETGDPEAMANLGICYLEGDGIPADRDRGMQWLNRAFRAGSIRARDAITASHLDKNGHPRNDGETFAWILGLTETAPDAKNWMLLYDCFEKGLGTRRCPEKAQSCLEQAAQYGNKKAQRILRDIQKKQCLNEHGWPLNDPKAFQWLKAHGEEEPELLYALGMAWEDGLGTHRDPIKAWQCYDKAAKAGNSDAAWIVEEVNRWESPNTPLTDWDERWRLLQTARDIGNDPDDPYLWRALGDRLRYMYPKGEQTMVMESYMKLLQMDSEGKVPYSLLEDVYMEGYDPQPVDSQEALQWFGALAKKYPQAGYDRMGQIYENGGCVPRDLAKAYDCYRKAGEAGNTKAAERAKNVYFDDKGKIINDPQTLLCIRKRIQKGEAEACIDLGQLYEWKLCGCERDLAKALDCYLKALQAQPENPRIPFRSVMNAGNYPQSGPESLRWYGALAEKDPDWGYLNMGILYAYGNGIPMDLIKADACYRKSHCPDAEKRLSELYYERNGNLKDDPLAMQWLVKQVQSGAPIPCYVMAEALEKGKGCEPDLRKAAQWYLRGAKQGEWKCQNRLGELYLLGKGVAPNDDQALYWFSQAADQGIEGACFNLGQFWENHPNKDRKYLEFAAQWYQKAGLRGREKARECRGRLVRREEQKQQQPEPERGTLGRLFRKFLG